MLSTVGVGKRAVEPEQKGSVGRAEGISWNWLQAALLASRVFHMCSLEQYVRSGRVRVEHPSPARGTAIGFQTYVAAPWDSRPWASRRVLVACGLPDAGHTNNQDPDAGQLRCLHWPRVGRGLRGSRLRPRPAPQSKIPVCPGLTWFAIC